MSMDAWESEAGTILRDRGLVYGSEKRRLDCIAWITDAKHEAKAIGYGTTEAEARWDAYRLWEAAL